ncbi:MAG: hypothetical protein RI894_942 [Bacteroidota bacterium]
MRFLLGFAIALLPVFASQIQGKTSLRNGVASTEKADLPAAPRTFQRAIFQDSLWQYMARYGKNKRFIESLTLQTLIALSYYPELRDVSIRFKFKNIKTTMQARPTTTSILNAKKKRVYTIFIDKKIINRRGVNIMTAPFNAQIGILGHELAHISDYESCSNVGILRFGFDYLDKRKKKNIEHYTDLITVAHGLGWQLYDWSNFVFEDSGADEKYLKFKAKYYLKPKEIQTAIEFAPEKGF